MLPVRTEELLSQHASLEVGGPADLFAVPTTLEEVVEALELADQRGLRVFVLGGGSNVLPDDTGFRGMVLSTRSLLGLRFEDQPSGAAMIAAAGESWDACVEASVDRGLSGVEALSGIPGTVGATPIQNVGAYGQEVSQTIRRVRVLDRRTRQVRDLSGEECGFGYRQSRLKSEPDRYVVLEVEYLLSSEPRAPRYAEVERALAGKQVTPRGVRDAVLSIRRSKSMVIDPGDENRRSAGSFFLNPTLPSAEASALVQRVVAAGLVASAAEVPQYPGSDGRTKLSAAWLIEKAGFTRGYGKGRVGISTRHTLALVNRGGGTAEDLLQLAAEIRRGVEARFGVRLEMEPVRMG